MFVMVVMMLVDNVCHDVGNEGDIFLTVDEGYSNCLGDPEVTLMFFRPAL